MSPNGVHTPDVPMDPSPLHGVSMSFSRRLDVIHSISGTLARMPWRSVAFLRRQRAAHGRQHSRRQQGDWSPLHSTPLAGSSSASSTASKYTLAIDGKRRATMPHIWIPISSSKGLPLPSVATKDAHTPSAPQPRAQTSSSTSRARRKPSTKKHRNIKNCTIRAPGGDPRQSVSVRVMQCRATWLPPRPPA